MPRLVLEDGSIYEGLSFGATTMAAGEVVFNTGMVGYVEALTDPSYRGQILVLTYPLVGNYGVPPPEKLPELKGQPLIKNFESEHIQVAGLIVADYSSYPSHWDCQQSLGDWLKSEEVPGLYGIDTRALTKKLRQKGTMLGKIVMDGEDIPFFDPNRVEIVSQVSPAQPFIYQDSGSPRIVLLDCGTKLNIIRSLLQRGCCVIRVPWNYDFFHLDFDGVVVSNGPGNPENCRPSIELVKGCLRENIPTLGICLGHQIMALAAGARTYKLKFGHRSQNQPCREVGTKRCYITSQNHGYAVETASLPTGWEEWFTNLNDGTNEGFRHRSSPFLGVQFHPEHSPGPVDTEFIFERFLELIK